LPASVIRIEYLARAVDGEIATIHTTLGMIRANLTAIDAKLMSLNSTE